MTDNFSKQFPLDTDPRHLELLAWRANRRWHRTLFVWADPDDMTIRSVPVAMTLSSHPCHKW